MDLGTGAITAEQAVQAAIDRANATRDLGAWTYLDIEAAQGAAVEVDRRYSQDTASGPLRGATFAVKESIAVAGMPFEAGTDAFRGDFAVRDAAVVARLRSAGAVALGMTTMHALGLGDAVEFGHRSTARHPWHDDYVPSGSSSGAAVAAAAGSCTFAIGGDTGGSVRGPAASCGVIGLKPTAGRVDAAGTTAMAWSMDTVGFFARDLSVIESVCTVLDLLDDSGTTGADPKVGTFGSRGLTGISSEISQMYQNAIAALTSAGGRHVEVQVPEFDSAPHIWLARMAEFRSVIGREMALAPSLIPESMHRVFEASCAVSVDDYYASWESGRRLSRQVDEALDQVDVLLLPATPTRTLTWDDWTGSGLKGTRVSDWYRYLLPFNITGHPAITIPWTLLDGVVPTSLQLVARKGEEATLLAVARFFMGIGEWPGITPLRVDALLRAAETQPITQDVNRRT